MLSFDLEFWWDTKYLRRYLVNFKDYPNDYIEESTFQILNLLDKHKIKATFFVDGRVTEKYPNLIKKAYGLGHEIACHGYSHRSLEDLNPREFEQDIKKSCNLIEDIIGRRPEGFRAPYFSLNNRTRWILPILHRLGFKYDSSIFPQRNFLYGVDGAPNHVYRISFENVAGIDSDSPLIEIPMTIYNFMGIKIPVAGGVYFRLMPLFMFKKLLRAVQKKRDPILYFHPHELFSRIPVIKEAPWSKRKLKYYGVKHGLKKFEKLIKSFKLISIDNFLNKNVN